MLKKIKKVKLKFLYYILPKKYSIKILGLFLKKYFINFRGLKNKIIKLN